MKEMANVKRTLSKPLSAAFVRTVKQPGRYGDGGRGSHGLYLRVWQRPSGRIGKAWAQRVRIGGRATNLGLGSYPVVTLAEARAKALETRRAIAQGRDPRERGNPTFRDAAEQVIAIHSRGWKPVSMLPQRWRQSLRDHVYPTFGKKRVSEVTSADVLAVLLPLWHTKPPTAQAVRQRIGTVMKWAIAKGFRLDNPAGDAISAALPKNGGPKHYRALPHSEVGTALAKMRVSAGAIGPRLAIEFLVLTAARSAEVRGARWSEIDLRTVTWEIPGERMKAGKPHRVPLSGRALEILAEARRRFGDSDLVFRSARGKAVTNAVLLNVLRRCGVDGTVHGFRTSFRTWAAEEGVDRQDAEMALAHAVRGVEGAYQRSDLLERRRGVMQAWAEYVLSE